MELPPVPATPGWRVGRTFKLQRGIALVPSILTVANIFLGYFSILKAFRGEFLDAAIFILIAIVLDKLDGLVARATGTASDFGKELDSLADIVSFGVAPSLLCYAWGLQDFGRVGSAVAFFFVGCGALRLARFNVQASTQDRRYFMGLPIPMASSLPVTLILAHSWGHPDGTTLANGAISWVFLALVVTLALLMVSRVRYFAFKDIHFTPRQRRLALLLFVTLVAGIAASPELVLPALSILYVSHGPLLRLVPSAWRRERPPREPPSAQDGDAMSARAADEGRPS